MAASWWFFSITLAAVYSGNLTAFLAVSNLKTPLKTFEDIAHQSDFQIGILGGSSDVDFFKVKARWKWKCFMSTSFLCQISPHLFHAVSEKRAIQDYRKHHLRCVRIWSRCYESWYTIPHSTCTKWRLHLLGRCVNNLSVRRLLLDNSALRWRFLLHLQFGIS